MKDPAKRAAYHYQRYTSVHRHNSVPQAQTALDVLQASLVFNNRMLRADPFRIDLDRLSFDIRQLLSDHHIRMLLDNGDESLNRQFVRNVAGILRQAPWFLAADSIASLRCLAETDATMQHEINRFLQNARREHYWERYKMLIALLAALLCCIAIFISVKK